MVLLSQIIPEGMRCGIASDHLRIHRRVHMWFCVCKAARYMLVAVLSIVGFRVARFDKLVGRMRLILAKVFMSVEFFCGFVY